MKTVFLIRHAKSSWSNPDLSDFDRPLNNRGERDVKMMSLLLSGKVEKIDLILTSTAKRALATTHVITADNGVDFDELIENKKLYHASAKTIRKVMADQSDEFKSLAIIGHNPGLTELANELGNVRIDNVPTTGILAFEFDIKKWQKILKKEGKLLFFDYPKRHKANTVK